MMRIARFISTVLATGCVAFASGYIVENGDAAAARIGASLQSPGMARAAVMPGVPSLPRPPVATLQATPLPTTYGWVSPQPESLPLSTLDRSHYNATAEAGQTCDAIFKATPVDGGLIRVSLVAPCSSNEAVTLRHAGLTVTERTNEAGRMTVELPAMTADAEVEAVMADGQRFASNILVPEAEDFTRVALIWRGDAGLHIHAHEFGAVMGAPGHIWAGSPGLESAANGGYLMTYGDRKMANATRAEVYTYPAGQTDTSGVVRLSIQAEVMNTNCGGMIAAQTLQPDGLGGVTSSDLTLRLPECDRIGEHMVLKNILRDLKIASK